MTGTREPNSNGLWYIDKEIITEPAHALLSVNMSADKADLVRFGHASFWSPAISTLEHALKAFYITNFPGLTYESLKNYPPQSQAMVMGHLDQARKNKQSTQPKKQKPSPLSISDPSQVETLEEAFPEPLKEGVKTQACYASVFQATGQVYTDQTGKFTVPSSSGNTQLFVLYDYDSNTIHAEPMKTKSAAHILAAYKKVHDRLVAAGLKPLLHKLDNECSKILKQFMADKDIDYQQVPPGCHRQNAAERAIRTFKNHFIAGLCSTPKEFPLHLWDQLVPQAVLTLNLLRRSRLNPKLSGYAQVWGPYDFN